MKILHFVLGKVNPDRPNGVNQVVYGLAKHMNLAGHDVRVLGISPSMEVESEVIDRQFFKVEVYRRFSGAGLRRFKQLAEECDLVHLHGVWNGKNVMAGRFCERIGKPYVVTPHGGYSDYMLRKSKTFLKLAYHRLFQKRLYEKASALHAITREEATDIGKYCRNAFISVIPNGIDGERMGGRRYVIHQGRAKVRFGFLGRLCREKNVDNLIRAFALLPSPQASETELYLIGPEERSGGELRNLVRQLKLEDVVHFVGPKYGDDKTAALLELDVYIHPSQSDVVSISVMEAFALGLPSIITRTSHMSYYNGKGAFVMCEPTPSDLCRAMIEMLELRDLWQEISEKACALCEHTFNWRQSAAELIRLYQSVCAKS